MSQDPSPDGLARWAFVLTLIGTVLYALAVYAFVLSEDVEHDGSPYGAVQDD